jgi:tripartite-type tricarboxylate transporter receptor subunit TctC
MTLRKSMSKRLSAALFAFMAANFAIAGYPDRPVTLIVTTAAGGPNDAIGRLVAAQLSEELRQSVIVENVAGAGGNIAAKRAADANPDGYTLLLMSTSLVVNPSLYAKVQYDPVSSYRPIGMIGTSPHILATNPRSSLNTLADIVAAARKHPGQLTYASGGNGTTSHLGMELLKSAANIHILHIPYKGAGPAMVDAAAGVVDMVMFPAPTLEQMVRSGRFVGVAVTDARRLAALPNVPTVGEAGFPQIRVLGWWGVVAPAKIPPDVVHALQNALARALAQPKLQQALKSQGLDVAAQGAGEFGNFIKTEVVKWRGIIKTSGAKVD